MVNGKFALLKNNNPTLRTGATSMAPYVTVLCFTLCLSSNSYSTSLPGKEAVAALYQKGTIHTTAHPIGRVADAPEGFDTSRLPQYGHLYREFGVHTAASTKPDGLLEFDIRILVPDTKQWQSMKSPPRNDSNAKGFCSLCRISINSPG